MLWSCVGIDRTRRAALRKRLLLGAGIVALGFASFSFTGGSEDRAAEARRVADAFTLARMTEGPSAARRYLAPAAVPLAAELPADRQTPAAARRLLRTGVSLDCGQTPILQSSSAQRAMRQLRRRVARLPLARGRPLVRGRLHPPLKPAPCVR